MVAQLRKSDLFLAWHFDGEGGVEVSLLQFVDNTLLICEAIDNIHV